MAAISIVLPTWNNAHLTTQCIASVVENSTHDIQFVWIDNGSDDENHSTVREALRGSNWVGDRDPYPLGFSRAVNRGLVRADGDFIAILNNDLRVTKGWDTELVNAVEENPGIAGPLSIGPLGWQNVVYHTWLGKVPYARGPDAIAGWLREHWSGKVVPLPETQPQLSLYSTLAFFCVLMPRDVRSAVGLLDEEFGWGYCEDNDYCWRARHLGFDLSLCPGAVVYHDGGQTMSKLGEEARKTLERNGQHLIKKHGTIVK
jgi:GT2 family glycosyltransferase